MARLGKQLHAGRPAAVAALAAGSTMPEAAAAAGVGVRTVARWRADPAFMADVQATRRAMIDRAAGRLAGKMTGAADVLVAIAEDAAQPAAVRCRAAVAVLDIGLKLADALDLADRVAAVEERLAALDAAAMPAHARRSQW